jgi:hypothetical protein
MSCHMWSSTLLCRARGQRIEQPFYLSLIPSSHFEPIHPAYNPSFSVYFFSRNSIFLSQQISQPCFSAGLSAQPNGAFISTMRSPVVASDLCQVRPSVHLHERLRTLWDHHSILGDVESGRPFFFWHKASFSWRLRLKFFHSLYNIESLDVCIEH